MLMKQSYVRMQGEICGA